MFIPVSKDVFMSQMERAESDISYHEETVRSFWDWMYRYTPGVVQVCSFPVPAKDQKQDDVGDGKWVHCDSYEEFEDFCSTHSDLWRYHVYSGVNTLSSTPEYGRGTMKHIDTVDHLSFDIETKRESYGGASKEEVWWTYRYALAQIKFMKEEYDVLPLVVMSENGIHLHYKANFENTKDTITGKQHIKSKYITHKAMQSEYVNYIKDNAPPHVDFDQDDVSDLPRVMKVPGTRGIKSQTGRLCAIIHQPSLKECGHIRSQDVNVDESFIENTNSKPNSESSSDESVPVSYSGIDADTQHHVKVLLTKDESMRQFWSGDTSGYDSRSEAEFAFILKLMRHDFSVEQIVNVMWSSGMSKWNEEDESYRQSTLSNAADWFDGNVVRDSINGSFEF
jgi:hypothetical protein